MGIPLTRDVVKESFERSTYTGFVATMLWGGLGLAYWRQLEAAMTIDKPEVEYKIFRIQNFLEEDRIQDAFLSLQLPTDNAQSNKFQGIDISYFTKLLYFLYKGKSQAPPIIFDKWGTFIHAGILISLNEIEVLNSYYKLGYTTKGRFYISIKSNQLTGYRSRVYEDYLIRMSRISKEYQIPHPGYLEEFLFGKDLKHNENKVDSNPRYFVYNYVKNSFDNGYAHSR